ncbi:MAG TPA: hypothetical protein VHM30_11915, partial [Gemmatimonadaceae bacterium]|nr:hypothetical protein [Gemmatimonadaceae bacterium]
MTRIRRTLPIALSVVAAACVTAKAPAALTQAEQLYHALEARGAEQRAEAEMIKTRQAVEEARMAVTMNRAQAYADGLAHVALRQAQTAEAEERRAIAAQTADSLRTARLNKLLTLTEAQRAALAQQQQLSQSEIAALRQQNTAAEQRADSLRRAAEEANAKLNDALTQLRSLVAEITNIKETSRGLVISLSDILFDVNKAT